MLCLMGVDEKVTFCHGFHGINGMDVGLLLVQTLRPNHGRSKQMAYHRDCLQKVFEAVRYMQSSGFEMH